MNKLLKNNPLFIIFVIPIIVDVVGTVLGQSAEYWSSGGKVFNEAVPFISNLLQINPLLFISVCLTIWLPFTYWLTKNLRRPLNLWATMSLLIGHGYNSVNWLRRDLYQAGLFTGQDQLSKALSLIPMTVYILFAGWVATKGFTFYMEKKMSKEH